MNDLEQALTESDDALDSYLSNTDVPQFRADLKQILDKHADTEEFKKKIIALIKAA